MNEAFARRTWPADQALGKRLRLFRDGVPLAWMTVVGVASDIIQDDRTRQVVEPLVYVPYQQRPQQNMFVFARTRVEPATLATAFTAEVYAMDPNLPTPGLMPLVERFARAYAFERNMTAVFLVFATVALFLALVGLYAIVAHSISTRTREIGIRRAMGATSRQIRGLVLRQGARPLGAGLIAGVLASVALSRTLQSILVRVSALDPATLSATSLLLIVTGAAGCLLSARHALRIDPAIVLRHE